MKSSESRVTRRAVLTGAAHATLAGAVLSSCQAVGSADESTADVPSPGRPQYVIWDAHGHLDASGEYTWRENHQPVEVCRSHGYRACDRIHGLSVDV